MRHSERVVLRALQRHDLSRSMKFFNNDLEVELAGGGYPPIRQSLERLQADFDRESAKGGRDGAMFAIDVDNEMIATCGLTKINETARSAELGIGIGNKAYWSQGYGREAVILLIDYAFRYRNLRRVWLWAHASNQQAISSYLIAGFVEEGRLREHLWNNGAYEDAVYMGVMRESWVNPLLAVESEFLDENV